MTVTNPQIVTDRPDPPNKDGRRLRGEVSAQRIIDATIELIAETGVVGATMQRIAGRAGSSNALVVFHFGSKDNLFHAVLLYLSDQYDRLWSAMVRRPDTPPEQRLLGTIDCAQHFIREHPEWVSAWVMLGSDRKTMQLDRQISLPNDLGYAAEARDLIRELAQAGGYPDVDADTLSAGLNYLVQGAWLWDNLNPEEVKANSMRKTALMLLSCVFPHHFTAAGPRTGAQ